MLAKSLKGKRRFVITSAQNATPVHEAFFANLLNYCQKKNAQLLVVPFRYKNPTSLFHPEVDHDDFFDERLREYLIDVDVDLNRHLRLVARLKTQPTAANPLQSLNTVTGPQSMIMGHPKVEMITVATPQTKLPKILVSTGCVTEKNYLDSKAGYLGAFHHSFAALVVEVDGDEFYPRQINALNDGSFCDLDTEYYDAGKKTRRINIAGLITGDEHWEVSDPQVVKATYDGKNSIVQTLRPEFIVRHDTYDGIPCNPHEKDSFITRYARYQAGQINVERSLTDTFKAIDEHTPSFSKNVFVPSNHNDFLTRWLESTDPRFDPENILFWTELAGKVLRETHTVSGMPVKPDPFTLLAKERLKTKDRSIFLERDQSFLIRGIEVGFHGDKGANGAVGSRVTFSKIGVKTVIGHSHSPGIKNGCYQVGTSSYYKLSYNSGPSSWLQTHCLIYPNGKRTLINIINGRWRLND